MANANGEQQNYIIEQMAQINPELKFESAHTYGAKFGIFYYAPPAGAEPILTANFAPIGHRKDWETEWSEFIDLAGDVLTTISAKYGAGGKKK